VRIYKDLVTDPFSGSYFVYRCAGNDFYLYSVGQDGKDEVGGGEVPFFENELLFYYSGAEAFRDIIFHAPAGSGKER